MYIKVNHIKRYNYFLPIAASFQRFLLHSIVNIPIISLEQNHNTYKEYLHSDTNILQRYQSGVIIASSIMKSCSSCINSEGR